MLEFYHDDTATQLLDVEMICHELLCRSTYIMLCKVKTQYLAASTDISTRENCLRTYLVYT